MSPPRRLLALVAAAVASASLAQCIVPVESESTMDVSTSWDVVYRVLQHPRCMNCHPAGDAPLQGDDGSPHLQNVMRGPGGEGFFAMRCTTCHETENAPGPHLPPGAPGWRLPDPDMPLVFEGKSPHDLCRQLRDPSTNGGHTPEELLEHVSGDPLVLWGWSPGEGRSPVPIPHDYFIQAMRAWVASGCECP